jgi:hypothetical protein
MNATTPRTTLFMLYLLCCRQAAHNLTLRVDAGRGRDDPASAKPNEVCKKNAAVKESGE